MDFEADPKYKFKPVIQKKHFFVISKSINVPFITQVKYCQKVKFEADRNNDFKPLMKKTISGWTLIKTPRGCLVFIIRGGNPQIVVLFFKLFSKGDQLKVKLANLKFSKLEMGPSFYYLVGFSNRGTGL